MPYNERFDSQCTVECKYSIVDNSILGLGARTGDRVQSPPPTRTAALASRTSLGADADLACRKSRNMLGVKLTTPYRMCYVVLDLGLECQTINVSVDYISGFGFWQRNQSNQDFSGLMNYLVHFS